MRNPDEDPNLQGLTKAAPDSRFHVAIGGTRVSMRALGTSSQRRTVNVTIVVVHGTVAVGRGSMVAEFAMAPEDGAFSIGIAVLNCFGSIEGVNS